MRRASPEALLDDMSLLIEHMISFEESQRLLLKHVKASSTVELPLKDSIGCSLATPVTARTDSPPFTTSAVDGYAIRLADFAGGVPITLPIRGTVHAGTHRAQVLKAANTIRVLTGASVPKNTEAIVMQENVIQSDGTVTFSNVPEHGGYIREHGAEFRRGERLFETGTIITPAVAQTLAACGYAKVKVHQRPSVSIIVTGNEIRPAGSKLKRGEIWDSNSTALETALRTLGIMDIRPHHISDDARSTSKEIRSALAHSDIVIATGGVSVGDRDFVKEAFAANGVREIFWRVAIRPGMPIYFGTKAGRARPKYIFGLPGNPVSVMVTYQLYVRRAILRILGINEIVGPSKAILSGPLKKSIARTEFVRARTEWTAERLPRAVPLSARESHMTTSMARADSLIVFPAERNFLAEGTEVEIFPIRWAAF